MDSCSRSLLMCAGVSDELRRVNSGSIVYQLMRARSNPVSMLLVRLLYGIPVGSEESIHEKLRAFMITRDKVLQMGYTSGPIDVTDPGRPTYSP